MHALPSNYFSDTALNHLPILFFDADDTLFDTNSWMRSYVARHTPHKLPEFDVRKELKLTELLGYAAESDILADAKFMREAPVMAGARWLLHVLDSVNYPYAVCTHRGYHKDGYDATIQGMQLLTKRWVPVYALDLNESKHDFISRKLSGSRYKNYLLVDDNTIPWNKDHTSINPLRWSSQICVDQSWNRTPQSGFARVITLDSVVIALVDRIEQSTHSLNPSDPAYAEINHVLWSMRRAMAGACLQVPLCNDEARSALSRADSYDAHVSISPDNIMQYMPRSPLYQKWANINGNDDGLVVIS